MPMVTRHFIVKEGGKVVETDIEVHGNDDVPEGLVINFLSIDEIVNDLVNRVLTSKEKHNIKTEQIEELNSLHPSLGSFIRNTYGLWLMPHPYANGRKSTAENSSENISKQIIEILQKRLI